MHLKTSHGTYVVIDRLGQLLHEAAPSAEDFARMKPYVTEIAALDGFGALSSAAGPFAGARALIVGQSLFLRKGMYFLCADDRGGLDFDRSAPGVWESFYIVSDEAIIDRAETFIQIADQTGTASKVHSRLEKSFEVLSAPINTEKDDLDWFNSPNILFFPATSGAKVLEGSYVVKGDNKYLSVKDRSQGVIFDNTGFYGRSGYLRLRPDMQDIVLTHEGQYLIRKCLSKNQVLRGSYISALDGHSDNYYHWMIEGMLCLYILRDIGLDFPPIIYVGKDGMKSWQSESLSILGFNNYLVVNTNCDDFLLVDELYWIDRPQIPFISGLYLSKFRNDMWFETKDLDSSAFPERIYIKRTGEVRSVRNAAETESLLIGYGFAIMSLEDMPVKHQICLFRSAKIIVGPHGAGLSNILFSQSGCLLIELFPEGIVRNFFWILASKLSIKYLFVRCGSGGCFNAPIQVDIEKLDLILQKVALPVEA